MNIYLFYRIHLIFVSSLLLFSHNIQAQKKASKGIEIERKYKQGETYSYRLTCEEFQNGKWTTTTISICNLKVIFDTAGIPFDEIKWLSVKRLSTKDTIDESKSANSTNPYRISLHQEGTLQLPKISDAVMTEPITDLNTFFVAVAPSIGVRGLKRVADKYTMPISVIGDFSNGLNILKGQDCLQISVSIKDETKQNVYLFTSFMPPSRPCFPYLIKDIETPVIADTINNFQMLTPSGNEKFNIQYGREYFYINSTVVKNDGKIAHAEMYNVLTLKMKINCDKNYQNCQAEIPFYEVRKLRLELISSIVDKK